MIFAAPFLILPPEKPAIVRAHDLSGLPSLEEMQRRQRAMFPFPFVPPSGSIAIGGIDANTLFMAHFDGTDGATTATDSSASARTITFNASAQIDTALSVFGGASLLFGGTADAITIPDSTDWNFSTGSYSFDFRLWPNGATGSVRCVTFGREDGNGSIECLLANTGTTFSLRVKNDAGTQQTSAGVTITNTAWQMINVVRTTGVGFEVFLNGVSAATLADTGSYSSQTDGWTIGARRNSSGTLDAGAACSVDEFRISNVARNGTVVPAGPYTA